MNLKYQYRTGKGTILSSYALFLSFALSLPLSFSLSLFPLLSLFIYISPSLSLALSLSIYLSILLYLSLLYISILHIVFVLLFINIFCSFYNHFDCSSSLTWEKFRGLMLPPSTPSEKSNETFFWKELGLNFETD